LARSYFDLATRSAVTLKPFQVGLSRSPIQRKLFGDNGDFAQLFPINLTTGVETLIGSTGNTFVGDLAFQPVPEPASLSSRGHGMHHVCAPGLVNERRVLSIRSYNM
jgi:hypothetical protein